MHIFARSTSLVTLAICLALTVAACTSLGQTDAEVKVASLECGDLLPEAIAADIFSDPSEDFVRVEAKEAGAVSPLVDEMVTEGIACGTNTGDSVVFIGALAMDAGLWQTTQADFAADGHDATDDLGIPGWVSVPKPNDDPIATSGFAWTDGVLYYATNPLVFSLMPAFAA
jgi:hypothetical protein